KYRDRVMPHQNPSAADLLTSTGLTARGPVYWGSPVTSDSPGVYVVESADTSDAAPIDPAAVVAWIKRVPTLLLDGRRPTAAQLTSHESLRSGSLARRLSTLAWPVRAWRSAFASS